jgi:hypothetical protein
VRLGFRNSSSFLRDCRSAKKPEKGFAWIISSANAGFRKHGWPTIENENQEVRILFCDLLLNQLD